MHKQYNRQAGMAQSQRICKVSGRFIVVEVFRPNIPETFTNPLQDLGRSAAATIDSNACKHYHTHCHPLVISETHPYNCQVAT